MAHKTLIGGTAYEVNGGKVLVSGTSYGIASGKTMVNGTGYDIPFSSGTPIENLPVGSSVYMNVNGTAKEFLIVHQGKPNNYSYDDSCNGTWLLMKDIYEKRQWNGTGENNYQNSTIHAYLNGTFLNLFDADIGGQIKSVKIPYLSSIGYGDAGVNKGANGLSAKIFLLSRYEVGYDTTSDIEFGEGVDYWDGSCLSYFSGCAEIDSKRTAYLNGESYFWHLRSGFVYNNVDVYGWQSETWYIDRGGGSYYGDCSASLGIRPALVLPFDSMVDEKFFII